MRMALGRLGMTSGSAAMSLSATAFGAVRAAFLPARDGASRYHADLYALARVALAALGVSRVYGGGFCTVGSPELFYSYRRDGLTGRMASLIWISHAPDAA